MKVMEEKKTEILTVRLTSSMKKALEKRARDGYRTLSQEVEMIISKALEKGKSR
jgi:hypothetical protein